MAWECVESFHIDHGELQGLSQELCFVLGVEWEQIRNRLEIGGMFSKLVHPENEDRIRRMVVRHGGSIEVLWRTDDWVQVRIVSEDAL